MSVQVRTSAVVVVVAAALATAPALAAPVQPDAYRSSNGEHFRYSTVLRIVPGVGEGVIASFCTQIRAPACAASTTGWNGASGSWRTRRRRLRARS